VIDVQTTAALADGSATATVPRAKAAIDMIRARLFMGPPEDENRT
jgi:hypothetical protein